MSVRKSQEFTSNECVNFFIFQIEYNAQRNTALKPLCCNDSDQCVEFTPWLLHHDNDVKEVVWSQPSITWYNSANQNIGIHTVYES